MTINSSFYDFLNAYKTAYFKDVPLSKKTTFEIGGRADLIVEPESVFECANIIKKLDAIKNDFFVLGKGSNLLCSDCGYRNVIIQTKRLVGISLIDETIIKCESGLSLAKLCEFAQKNALSGLEFAFGIPGSVGGAIYMNAGAYGGEIKDVLLKCDFADNKGNLKTLPLDKLGFSYRKSYFCGKNYLITAGYFKLKKGNGQEIKKDMAEILNRRKLKQPLEFPSAGSVFKRPEKGYASALIESCGLKGVNVGGAYVSEKHAGFIINKGGATCGDVLALIDLIKKTVLNKTGIELEPEIRLLK